MRRVKALKVVLYLLGIFTSLHAIAQSKPTILHTKHAVKRDTQQLDMMQIVKKLFVIRRHDSISDLKKDSISTVPSLNEVLGKPIGNVPKPTKLYFAVFPAVGYTLQTGTTAIVAMNLSFYNGKKENTNLSSIALNPAYSINRHQFLVPLIFNAWAKKNKYNFLGDWRYYKYPTYTYGLGGHTTLGNADLIDYSYIRIYQQALKQIAATKCYMGIGYNLDYHFGIRDEDPGSSNFQSYNNNAKKTVSSGMSFVMLYDSRKNINYPISATYANIAYRYNAKVMGSDQNWQSVIAEFKKYIKVFKRSNNVLAFWSLNWFTFGGAAPYFDLPSTGWDSYSNSGRGYIQGRLRGPAFVYLESEYRFGLTKNGLLGGVVFVNAQSVSELKTNQFQTIFPGTGLGLRVKINRMSNTNLAIDYGFGIKGSHGLFLNLSEVF